MVAGKRLAMVKNITPEQLPWTTSRLLEELDGK
jgi:hypothetical protein